MYSKDIIADIFIHMQLKGAITPDDLNSILSNIDHIIFAFDFFFKTKEHAIKLDNKLPSNEQFIDFLELAKICKNNTHEN